MISAAQSHVRAWLVVVLLWFAVFSNFFARMLPTAMHGSLVGAIPMTETQFGLLTSCLFWTYGLMSPFGGFFADRFSRSWVIITSMCLWSVITCLTSYTRTFEQLLILRLLMGVSEACYLPTALALISDYHKGATRSLATGIHQSGSMIGIGMSGLGGWLAAQYSWHFTFKLVGLAGIAYSVLLAFTLRDAPRERPMGAVAVPAKPKVRVGEALGSLLGRPSFILTAAAAGTIGLAGWTVTAWLPVFLLEHFNQTQSAAGITATICTLIPGLPGLLIGGFWADRWSRTNGRARMYVPAIGLFVASPGILLAAHTNVLVVAVLGLVIYRMAGAFIEANMMPILCEVVDPRYRATGYGLLNLLGAGAAGFGIYFSGVLRDVKIDLSAIFDVIGAISVICGLMFYFIKPTVAGPKDENERLQMIGDEAKAAQKA